MANLILINSDDEVMKAFIQSELSRGHDLESIEEMVWLFSRVKFLKTQSKPLFSKASNEKNKKIREDLRQEAIMIERVTEEMMNKVKTTSQKFGNIILQQEEDKRVPFLSSYSFIELLLGKLSEKWRKRTSWLSSSLYFSAPSSNYLDSYLKILPFVHILDSSQQEAVRYYFDPNLTLQQVVYQRLLHTLEIQLKLPNKTQRRKIPDKRLHLSFAYSTVLTLGRKILAKVSFESDFVSRILNVRIDKSKRGKIAISLYPSSFLIEIYGNVEFPSTLLEDVDLKPSNSENLLETLNSGDILAVFDIMEDSLETRSFLSDGGGPSQLDEQIFNYITLHDQKLPPIVQYPCIHRWFRFLRNRPEVLTKY